MIAGPDQVNAAALVCQLARADVGRADAAAFRTGPGRAWCMYYVSSLLERAGLDAPAPDDPARRGARAGLHWLAARGSWVCTPTRAAHLMRADRADLWRELAEELRPGDVAAWRASLLRGDWRGHVAVVVGVDLAGARAERELLGLVESVGGNEGGGAGEVRLTTQTIRAWARKRPGGLLGVARPPGVEG